MLANWLNHFFEELEKEKKQNNISIQDAFRKLQPAAVEKQYKDADLAVRGFIDAIHKEDDDVMLLDYKTSKSSDLRPEYLLQMGIYALGRGLET